MNRQESVNILSNKHKPFQEANGLQTILESNERAPSTPSEFPLLRIGGQTSFHELSKSSSASEAPIFQFRDRQQDSNSLYNNSESEVN